MGNGIGNVSHETRLSQAGFSAAAVVLDFIFSRFQNSWSLLAYLSLDVVCVLWSERSFRGKTILHAYIVVNLIHAASLNTVYLFPARLAVSSQCNKIED